MSRQTIPLTLGFGLAALAGTASAQSCASRDDVIARAGEGFIQTRPEANDICVSAGEDTVIA